ncbi:MAG TPA: MarR family transcriptional regulator [Candidatus Dormibacteraeota bacterium]|nr:MarR family transcriptional regulator [Candidatus Dormibacteraeota bacterium]HKF17547.1 MarR family transcriptional regulator [Candidatus Dormibacteraeota bacterium]
MATEDTVALEVTDKKADLATEVWRLLYRSVEAQQERWRHGFDDLGLTFVQRHFLMELASMPPSSMSTLARRMDVDPSWVTGVIDHLEQRGYVQRRPARHDRRVKLVDLTPEGRQTSEALGRLRDEPPATLLGMPESDLRELLRIMCAAVDRQNT